MVHLTTHHTLRSHITSFLGMWVYSTVCDDVVMLLYALAIIPWESFRILYAWPFRYGASSTLEGRPISWILILPSLYKFVQSLHLKKNLSIYTFPWLGVEYGMHSFTDSPPHLVDDLPGFCSGIYLSLPVIDKTIAHPSTLANIP